MNKDLPQAIDFDEVVDEQYAELAAENDRLRAEIKKNDAWLGQAHVLCSDMSVPHGHIEDRLFEAIGKAANAGRCVSCRHWKRDDGYKGRCSSDKFEYETCTIDGLAYWDSESYSAGFGTGEMFGCIHWCSPT